MKINKNNIRFINDSKATNVTSTICALSSFANIYWIAGGIAKDDGLPGIEPYYSNIRGAYLIGQASHQFAKALFGHVKVSEAFNLNAAVKMATEDALHDLILNPEIEPVILLSPACASFDQFRDFEDRGDYFRRLVNLIGDENASPL